MAGLLDHGTYILEHEQMFNKHLPQWMICGVVDSVTGGIALELISHTMGDARCMMHRVLIFEMDGDLLQSFVSRLRVPSTLISYTGLDPEFRQSASPWIKYKVFFRECVGASFLAD